jgi:mono/diheme cytochrome c family protein
MTRNMSFLRRSSWVVMSGAALFSLGACSSDDETAPANLPLDPDPTSAGAAPTFYQDVGPIFSAKCMTCHQEGGVAPFALNDYEAAKARGMQIADYTANRVMPPYAMQTGGACGSFDESRALTPDEIALIGTWGRGDRAEGTFTELTVPALPTLAGGTDFMTPEFVPQIIGTELAEFDEYRCFLVDPGREALSFITGYDVLPRNTTIVHHVLGFLVDPSAMTRDGRTNAAVMQGLHDADPTPEREGWTCFGAAGEGVEVEAAPVVWAPGQGVVNYAGGVGVPFPPGRQLVVQVHYNLADSATIGQSDQTRVRLRFEPTVARPAFFLLEDPFLDSIYEGPREELAPGQASVKYSWQESGASMGIPAGAQAEVLGIFPHMHQRGRKFTFEVDNGSGFECQGQIDRWDFGWQRHYDYTTPLPLTADTRVRVTCDFDTSDATEPVLPGWSTTNEMCLATLMVAVPAGL